MQNVKDKVSVIIPTYNEEGSILKAIEAVRSFIPEAEIIISDDGSQDKTVDVANNCHISGVKVVSGLHRGKGSAMRRAIGIATGSIMLQLDADLQFPIEGARLLIDPIVRGEADFVFSSRYLDKSKIEKGSLTFPKMIASFIVAKVVSLICWQRFTDVFSGLKAWRSDAIRNIDIREQGFAYEAEIAIKAKRKKYCIMEVPTAYKRRISGNSKIRFIYHAPEIFLRLIYLFIFAW